MSKTVVINLANEADLNVVLRLIDDCLMRMPIGDFEVYRGGHGVS